MHIVDTTLIRNVPLAAFVVPPIVGHTISAMPAYSFLVEHIDSGTGKIRRLVFDLAVRKDWWNLAPAQVARIRKGGWEASVQKNVADVLADGGIPVETIEAVIWR